MRISVGDGVRMQVSIANRDVLGELLGMAVDDGEGPLVGFADGVAVGAYVVFSGRVCSAVKCW